jgi:glycosyltransferase involved in cell wall biosynthesis
METNCPIPYIYTIHDLIRLKHPHLGYSEQDILEKYGEGELHIMRAALASLTCELRYNDLFLNYFWLINKYLTANSHYIATVSQPVQNDIVNYFDVPISKTVVISGAVNERFLTVDSTTNFSSLFDLELQDNYCLYVGLNHKHKRVRELLRAFSRCLPSAPSDASFVFVCQQKEHIEQIWAMAAEMRLDKQVVCLNDVTDEILFSLYSGARAYVTASVDEGYGLPVQEALSCGTEVIVPDIPIMREMIKNAGHYYHVNDFEQLKDLLVSAYNGNLTQKARGFRLSSSWDNSARTLLSLFASSC